ncbi:hypothetical protein HN873_011566 [Arachis hypogaea]
MLTFEGQKIQGAKNIAAKLTSLPFNQCVYSITTVDCQPSSAPTACLSSLAATSSSPASNTLSSSAKCSICYQHHREAAMLAIEKILSQKLEGARTIVQLKIAKALKEYRNLYAVQHCLANRMIYPESLKLLMLYGLALCRSMTLRGGFGDAPLDERCA